MDAVLRAGLLVLALCGATIILTRSYLFAGLRGRLADRETLYELVRCPLCSGAWLGAGGWLLVGLVLDGFTLGLLGESVIVGLAVAFISAAVGGTNGHG